MLHILSIIAHIIQALKPLASPTDNYKKSLFVRIVSNFPLAKFSSVLSEREITSRKGTDFEQESKLIGKNYYFTHLQNRKVSNKNHITFLSNSVYQDSTSFFLK
jgi:hypothetical protein